MASGQALLIGSVSLLALYGFLKAYRMKTEDLDQLYAKNVAVSWALGQGQQGYGDDAATHTGTFGLDNNGITIVVADFRKDDTSTFTLMDPYIVNGCQTSAPSGMSSITGLRRVAPAATRNC